MNNFAERLKTTKRLADKFEHCFTISAVHLPGQPLVYVNTAFELLTGYSREDSIGRNCNFLQGPERAPEADMIRTSLDRNEAGVFFITNFCANGASFVNRLILLPFPYLSSGEKRYYIGIQSRAGSDSVPAADEATSRTLQHEINNPLTIALWNLEFAEGSIEDVDAAITRIERYADTLWG